MVRCRREGGWRETESGGDYAFYRLDPCAAHGAVVPRVAIGHRDGVRLSCPSRFWIVWVGCILPAEGERCRVHMHPARGVRSIINNQNVINSRQRNSPPGHSDQTDCFTARLSTPEVDRRYWPLSLLAWSRQR